MAANSSVLTQTSPGAPSNQVVSLDTGHWVRNRLVYTGGAVIIALAAGLRIFLESMAFTVGTDYYSAEFQTYWMPLLYAEVTLIPAFTVVLSLYFWLTRETDVSSISKELELSRYWKLLACFSVMGLWGTIVGFASLETDASWHQVTIRDTDFTPTHIILFYCSLPFLTAMLICTFCYAHTRIPNYMHKVSLPFLAIVLGIFMIIPNYAFNEWGHTFFYAEELFAAPIHWGFVLLAWSLFFLVPFIVQIFAKMGRLIAETTSRQH